MAETAEKPSFLSAEWVLRELPVITYFCENDGLYTMRWICAGGGNPLGYDLQDFVDNKHYFAASAVHPQDLDVVDEFAEITLGSARPAIARYRMVTQDGGVVPTLFTARAVCDAAGKPFGFCGMVLNLNPWPELQGHSRVLTESVVGDKPVAGAARPAITPQWVMGHAPAVTFVIGDDPNHTLHFAGGVEREIAGYDFADFLPTGRYQPSSAVFPSDLDVLDACAETAVAEPGDNVAARLRVVHAGGAIVPVLLAARAVMHKGVPHVVGVTFDLGPCPALQGQPMVFESQ